MRHFAHSSHPHHQPVLTMRERSGIMVSMNRLTTEKRAQIVGSLVEGNSIRATVRMTGAAKNTVTKLLTDLGEACADYQDRTLVDLPCTTVQCLSLIHISEPTRPY